MRLLLNSGCKVLDRYAAPFPLQTKRSEKQALGPQLENSLAAGPGEVSAPSPLGANCHYHAVTGHGLVLLPFILGT
jgi:hypothetical protein